jgi:NTE family protein
VTSHHQQQDHSPPTKPTVGLALGGGGARGIAHILMLEVFDELGIKPSVIAGTSIGALYGAAYASGLSAKQIRAYTDETLGRRFDLARQLFAARSEPVNRLLRFVPVRNSLLNPAALLDLIYPGHVAKDFADLVIPLKIVATDLASHEARVLTSGPLRSAVAASVAIPVLFSAVMLSERMLVDGGLVNPLPYDLIESEADISVAIDVTGATGEAEFSPRPTPVEVLVQSIQILQKSITKERLRYKRPDIYIEVDVDRFGALEFHRPQEILAAAEPAKEMLKRELSGLLARQGERAARSPKD